MMKKVLIVLQIALFALFLYNTGIFGIFSHLPPLQESAPVNHENFQKLNQFVFEKVRLAREKGTSYSPDCYFSDLIEIEKKKRELTGPYINGNLVNSLCALSMENTRHGRYSENDISIAREKYQEFIDPGRESREQIQKEIAQKTFWPKVKKGLVSFFFWLLAFYFKNLPLALVLFFIWWYKEYKTIRIRNPFSFAISVLSYPYVIGKMIQQWLKDGFFSFHLEIELRRTKEKFFTLLSRDEISDIRRFAKSNLGRKQFKKRLQLYGKEFKRSFGSALVATLLLSFVSVIVSNLQAETMPIKSSCQGSQIVNVHESPPDTHVLKDNITKKGNPCSENIEEALTIALELFKTDCQSIILKLFFRFSVLIKKIEHIPLAS